MQREKLLKFKEFLLNHVNVESYHNGHLDFIRTGDKWFIKAPLEFWIWLCFRGEFKLEFTDHFKLRFRKVNGEYVETEPIPQEDLLKEVFSLNQWKESIVKAYGIIQNKQNVIEVINLLLK